MTYLSLDVGSKRIGVAVGSTDVKLASALRVIQRENLESDARRIKALAAQYDAGALLVGLPRELDGLIGAQARRVMDYADRLAPLAGLPIVYSDERYSTAQALARRREVGLTEKRGRSTIDAAAAAVILQDYFDSLSPSPAPGDLDR